MIITVSRQTGSLGLEIAELLAAKLKYPVITRDYAMSQWFPLVATKHELHMLEESPVFFLNQCSEGISFAEFLEKKLKEFTGVQPAIIFGLGSQIIFAHDPQALHVKIIASQEVRTKRIIKAHGIEQADAKRFLQLTDRKHKRYIAAIYDVDWADPSLYHILLNTDFINIDEASSLLYYLVQNRQNLPAADTTAAKENLPIIFKHPSEAEFAEILDMHNIQWEYEPRTFPIGWDTEGNITRAFSPDFYLPRFNTYIELTTMDQKYVSEKKKKVQLLKKLYPGTNINIVFKNDFYSLVKRFKPREGTDI